MAQLDVEKYEQMLRTSGCFALGKVARAVAGLYDQMLAPTGLQVMELGILRVCGLMGPISVGRLATELAAGRSSMLRSVRPLVGIGLLRRVRVRQGDEKSVLELTSAGRVALAQAIVQWDQAQRDLIDQIGEARWTRLKSELSAIAGIHFDPSGSSPASR